MSEDFVPAGVPDSVREIPKAKSKVGAGQAAFKPLPGDNPFQDKDVKFSKFERTVDNWRRKYWVWARRRLREQSRKKFLTMPRKEQIATGAYDANRLNCQNLGDKKAARYVQLGANLFNLKTKQLGWVNLTSEELARKGKLWGYDSKIGNANWVDK